MANIDTHTPISSVVAEEWIRLCIGEHVGATDLVDPTSPMKLPAAYFDGYTRVFATDIGGRGERYQVDVALDIDCYLASERRFSQPNVERMVDKICRFADANGRLIRGHRFMTARCGPVTVFNARSTGVTPVPNGSGLVAQATTSVLFSWRRG